MRDVGRYLVDIVGAKSNADACAVEDRVESAVLLFDFLEHLLDLLLVGHVSGEEHRSLSRRVLAAR